MNATLLSLPILDVEASGLHLDSYPIEIAVLAGTSVPSWLIAPARGWTYWSSIAEGMHGISRDTLRAEGIEASIVARELNAAVEMLGGVVYSDAAEWDRDWIETLYQTVRIACGFRVLPIQQLLSPKQEQRFTSARQQLETSGRYRVHRAGPDVRLIFEAYRLAARAR